MMQMFIEGFPVDVHESFSTVITLAIDDIKDFGSRNSTFSKTIILPGTKRNNLLFGNIFDVKHDSDYSPTAKNAGINFNAAVGASVYIFNDNIQQVKGVFRLLEIILDNGNIEYEGAVFGELGGLIAKLGNLKLEQLDFSANDHTYSLANIIASWDTASVGSGYYYPLLDYGNYSPAKHHWQYRALRPAFYVKEYIDKIIANAGYTYDAALFSTTRFKSLVVPNNTKTLSKISATALDVATAVTQTYENPDNVMRVDWEIQTTMGSFVEALGDSSLLEFTGTASMPVTASLHIVGGFWNNYAGNLGLNLYVGTSLTTYYFPEKDDSSLQAFDITLPLDAVLNTGNFVYAEFFCVSTDEIYKVEVTAAELVITAKSLTAIQINLGEQILANDILPKNVLQKDFLSSVVKLFNLYLFESRDDEKKINISPFPDFYLEAVAEDWSLKVDREKPIRIKPMSELNSRYFEFNYAEDSDFYNDLYKKRYNETYGSYKFDSEFEFAKEVQKAELIFAGTPLVGYAGEDKVYSTIFKRTGDTVGTGEENVDSKIRILQAKKVTGVTSWNVLNGVTVLDSYTDYGYAGHLDDPDNPGADLNFGVVKELFFTLATGDLTVNQFNVYWSSYMAEITDKESRLLQCVMKLSYKDIYNLDFSKLKYIDGVLYRLNKLEDFNVSKEDTCKAEFLKIINRIY